MLEPEILLTLNLGQQLFADPRRVCLLKQIEQTGSLSRAAKEVGISYKTAWDAINEMNKLAPKVLVNSSVGGKGGGGAQLSAYAVRFIQLYDLLTQIQSKAFHVLNDDNVPLDNLLAATARLSLQTSARNQLYATVQQIHSTHIMALLDDQQTALTVNITQQSIERLKLSKNKAIILLIKAPAVTISLDVIEKSNNHFAATITHMSEGTTRSEIALSLATGISVSATKLTTEIHLLGLSVGQSVYVDINPDNIIVAALA